MTILRPVNLSYVGMNQLYYPGACRQWQRDLLSCRHSKEVCRDLEKLRSRNGFRASSHQSCSVILNCETVDTTFNPLTFNKGSWTVPPCSAVSCVLQMQFEFLILDEILKSCHFHVLFLTSVIDVNIKASYCIIKIVLSYSFIDIKLAQYDFLHT